MIRTKYALAPLAVVFAISMGGCAGTGTVQTAMGPMPEYCLYNNAATGAVIGTLLGAGIGAAIGGGRGAAIGAASGMALGGMSGAQADAQCRQIALQRTMEMVLAQQQQQMQMQQQQQQQAAAAPVVYQPVEYATPSNNRRNRITPTNSFTDPATKTTCASFTEVSFDEGDKPAQSRSGRICKKADGTVSES